MSIKHSEDFIIKEIPGREVQRGGYFEREPPPTLKKIRSPKGGLARIEDLELEPPSLYVPGFALARLEVFEKWIFIAKLSKKSLFQKPLNVP